jgi:hypothetical protein
VEINMEDVKYIFWFFTDSEENKKGNEVLERKNRVKEIMGSRSEVELIKLIKE